MASLQVAAAADRRHGISKGSHPIFAPKSSYNARCRAHDRLMAWYIQGHLAILFAPRNFPSSSRIPRKLPLVKIAKEDDVTKIGL